MVSKDADITLIHPPAQLLEAGLLPLPPPVEPAVGSPQKINRFRRGDDEELSFC
jgi:hypothetical protein